MAEDWHTLGGRLRWAIEQQPAQGRRRGLRLFQGRMDKRFPDLAGTSLTAIQGYLRDETEPSPQFIEEAATLLGVRPEWLAWGRGTPFDEHQSVVPGVSEVQLRRVSDGIYSALGIEDAPSRFARSAVWAPVARATVLRLYQMRSAWEVLAGRPDPIRQDADAAWERALKDVATAIAAPLRATGLEGSRLSLEAISDHVQTTALALQRIYEKYTPEDVDADEEET